MKSDSENEIIKCIDNICTVMQMPFDYFGRIRILLLDKLDIIKNKYFEMYKNH
jgi:hypothetical protein